MKIICGIFSRNNYILHIEEALRAMGHEVQVFLTDDYRQVCSYPQKKLDKLGFLNGRRKYICKWKQQFLQAIDTMRPDRILFVNSPRAVLTVQDLLDIHERVPLICWFVDGIASHPELAAYYPCFHKLYVFEKSDVDYLREQYDVVARYCPVGYNEAYANVPARVAKTLDILFIGSPFHNRLAILEPLAEYAEQKCWNMQVYGPFYDAEYFWKQYLFSRRYPHLARCLVNGTVSSEIAASLYSKAKICLNIHSVANRSPNPRTFEILATKSFEIVDERDGYAGLLRPGIDLEIFCGFDDLCAKVQYYLQNADERVRIASHGRETVLGRCSIGALLAGILQ